MTAGFIKDVAGNAATTDVRADGTISYSDVTAPTVTSFSSTTANGTYNAGDTINITATMSETVQAGATFNATLSTNDVIALTAGSTGTTLSGSYTVGLGDNSTDLTVNSYTAGTVSDLYGNAMAATTLPANNLANNKAIVIDTIGPFNFDNGTLVQNDGNSTADAGDSLVFAFTELIGNTADLAAFFNTSDTYGATATRALAEWSNGDKTLTVTLGVGETYDAATAITLNGVQDFVGNLSNLTFTFL